VADHDAGAQAGHTSHDELLIAAWVSGDVDPADAARAGAQADRCDACRELASDLRQLRAAVRALPPAPRTRDFRLTPADAHRIQSGRGWLGRLRRGLGAGVARPLAGAMTAVGVAGLVVTSMPLAGAGAGAARPAIEAQSSPAAVEAPAGAPAAEPLPAASQAPEAATATGHLYSSMDPDAGAGGMTGQGSGQSNGEDVRESSEPVARAEDAHGAGDPTSEVAATTESGDARPALALASALVLAIGVIVLVATGRRREAPGR
jgi:hypothetical protein